MSFQLKKSKADELGRVPIYVRITINGVRTEFSIKRSVEPGKWISAAGVVKGNSEESKNLNAFLAAVRLRLNEIYRELLESKETITVDTVKNHYLGVNVRTKTILDVFEYRLCFPKLSRCKRIRGDLANGYPSLVTTFPNNLGFIWNNSACPSHTPFLCFWMSASPYLSSLKNWGYLLPSQMNAGTIHWSRNGERYASISIQVNMGVDEPYLELNYRCNNVPICYRIRFVSKASNLGKGRLWFFRCPHTGKLCRKLYMIQTHFLHMKAFRGAMYEKQTYSKHARGEIRLFDRLFKSEKAFELQHAKYFRKYYKGVPTKRYSRLKEPT